MVALWEHGGGVLYLLPAVCFYSEVQRRSIPIAKGKYQRWLTDDGLLCIEGWARDGLTDEQIAANIGIGKTAFYEWQNRFPKIADALKRGKAPVDIEVENALLKRALGYDAVEVTTETITTPDGKTRESVKRYVRHIPPDTTAQIFWLKNRKPVQWRDKREVDDSLPSDDPLLEMLKRWDDAAGK